MTSPEMEEAREAVKPPGPRNCVISFLLLGYFRITREDTAPLPEAFSPLQQHAQVMTTITL
jgi:hypothetical protein